MHASLTADIETAHALLVNKRLAFITGAGVSTDSGIPDYRGAGSPVRSPMDISAFLTNVEARKRYWAGGHLGWRAFDATQPNTSHKSIAQFETAGLAVGTITQNVDGLHVKAGSSHLVELHGTGRRVSCTKCGQVFDRRNVADRMERDNPWILAADASELGPDGDVVPQRLDEFVVPDCTVCGGVLRPDIVFFGEFIPRARFAAAEGMIAAAEAIVVAGTSLTVNSPVRLLDRARKRHLPIIIINRGVTKWDSHANLKIDAGTSDVLPLLASSLGITA